LTAQLSGASPSHVAAIAGVATTLMANTSPRATRILIIFFTSSFLLSCSQAFPDFQAVFVVV